MPHQTPYTLTELSHITGVTPRSIRAYIQAGVVPHPVGRTRGARYTDEHVVALQRHLARKVTTALDRSARTTPQGATGPEATTSAIWVELAPDIKVLLLPNTHGRTQEQLMGVMKLMTAVCAPMLRSTPVGTDIEPVATAP